VLKRLVDDLGMTVVLSEHRLERVSESADLVIALGVKPHQVVFGNPHDVFATSPIVPPVTQLGLAAGWHPLPVTVKDGRGHARNHLRLAAVSPEPHYSDKPITRSPVATQPADQIASVTKLGVNYQTTTALKEATLAFSPGEVTALMGRNGSGKTTLLSCLVGLIDPTAGKVQIAGEAPSKLKGSARISRVGLVPSEPADLFFCETVEKECQATDKDAALLPGTTANFLHKLAPEVGQHLHPRDLSEGQQLCLALAITCAAGPKVLLLDEPTRGLDYPSKQILSRILAGLRQEGRAIVIATHDVEFVATVADRVIVLAQGEVVADENSRAVLTSSPMFAPQIKKVFPDRDWLTVPEALAGLAATA
jgi:energy-coupling factor transport system ATP-binding protein